MAVAQKDAAHCNAVDGPSAGGGCRRLVRPTAAFAEQFTANRLLSPDLFHMNDLSYGCLATLMADAIEEQVKSAPAGRETATAPRR
jgi:hypothetical protein